MGSGNLPHTDPAEKRACAKHAALHRLFSARCLLLKPEAALLQLLEELEKIRLTGEALPPVSLHRVERGDPLRFPHPDPADLCILFFFQNSSTSFLYSKINIIF